MPITPHSMLGSLAPDEMELRRPYFWFQAGVVDTTAYVHEGRLAFVHSLRSQVPGEELHGVAIERF